MTVGARSSVVIMSALLRWSTGRLVARRRARRLLLRAGAAPPARLPGRRRRAQRWLEDGPRRHLVQMNGPAGRHGHEVFAAEHLLEQELREHVRLQREL